MGFNPFPVYAAVAVYCFCGLFWLGIFCLIVMAASLASDRRR